MSDLTPEALDRLAQLDADATPGPWEVTLDGVSVRGNGNRDRVSDCRASRRTYADAALIAETRNHLPALLDAARERDEFRDTAFRLKRRCVANAAERDAARAEVAALRERIEALADSIHGDAGCEHNGGCAGEPDCLACIEAELRAALADPATAKEADGG